MTKGVWAGTPTHWAPVWSRAWRGLLGLSRGVLQRESQRIRGLGALLSGGQVQTEQASEFVQG